MSFSLYRDCARSKSKLLLEVGLRLGDVGLGGAFGGHHGVDVGLRGFDGGLLRGDGSGGLDVLDGGENGARLDVITLFYVEVSDASEGGGSYVDVGLGLDLAGSINDGDEVLLHSLAGRYLGDGALALEDGARNDASQDNDSDYNQNNLLRAH